MRGVLVFRAHLRPGEVPAMAELSPTENHRRDCLARHFLNHWTRQDIVEWLEHPKRGKAFRDDMRARLNRLKQEYRKR